MGKKYKAHIMSGAIGNAIEWYDFAIFGFLTPILANQFFSHDNHIIAIIYTFGLFAVGFLSRPLGGILFGYIGDKYGRTISLRLTVLVMSVPTTLIGLMPSFHTIGIASPLLVMLLRLLQGVAMGGEFTGSVIYLAERAAPKRKAFASSFAYVSTTSGILLGSLAVATLHHLFSNEEVINWAWRIPFILGIAFGGFAYWLRTKLEETLIKNDISRMTNPLKKTLLNDRKAMLLVAGLNCFNAVAFYTLFIFMHTYLTNFIHLSAQMVSIITTFSLLILILFIIISGYLADHFGAKRLLIVGLIGVSLMCLLGVPLMDSTSVATTTLILLATAMFFGLFQGAVPCVIASQFPASTRYSGLSISFNVSNALLGGTAPIIAVILIQTTNWQYAFIPYLLMAALVTLITLQYFSTADHL